MFDVTQVGRWRAYDGVVFFSAWVPENESGITVAGSWRNAWSTDDHGEALAVVERLNALGRRRWGVTTYGGGDMPRRAPATSSPTNGPDDLDASDILGGHEHTRE